MFMPKPMVLQNAYQALNRPNQPWFVSIEGNTIVAKWKWMDAVYFSPTQVTDEVRNYTFRVTLLDNGKWKEQDITENTVATANLNGKIGARKDFFVGKTTQKTTTITFGQDRNTGNTGMNVSRFDTSIIKNSVRGFLTSCGWKKAGFFG